MKKLISEFKTFISKGNVLDMAIGVIIGSAFGKITTSLVNELLMPFIGLIFGGTDATQVLNVTVRKEVLDEAGNVVTPATVLAFGNFINTVINFIVIAFVCFVIIKVFNKAKEMTEKKKLEEEAAAKAKADAEAKAKAEEEAKAAEYARNHTPEIELLTEIRNLLQKK